eukprot:COSAG01_NODE_8739_length_2676_cov_9.886690_2_plen_222_part_01
MRSGSNERTVAASLGILATRRRPSLVHMLGGTCSCCQLERRRRSAAAASSQRRQHSEMAGGGGGRRTAISLQHAEIPTRRVGEPGHQSLMASPSLCKVRVCSPVQMRHAAYRQDGHDEQPVMLGSREIGSLGRAPPPDSCGGVAGRKETDSRRVAASRGRKQTPVTTFRVRHCVLALSSRARLAGRPTACARGEPVSSDYHNKNLQISSGGAAARAGLIDRS